MKSFFKSASIKQRLVISFSILIFIFILTLANLLTSKSSIANDYEELLNNTVSRSQKVSRLETLITDTRREFLLAYRVEGADEMPLSQLTPIENRLLQNIQEMKDITTQYRISLLEDPILNEQEINYRMIYVNSLEEAINRYESVLHTNFLSSSPNRNLGNTELGAIADIIKENIDSLTQIIDSALNTQIQTINSAVQRSVTISVIAIIVSVLATILLSIILVRGLANSLNNFTMNVKKVIEDGNFDIQLRSNNTDEISIMSNMVADMVDVFKLLLENINTMAAKFKDGDIDANIDESMFKGGYKEVAVAINNTVEELFADTQLVLNVVSDYANGNFESKINRFPGKKSLIHEEVDKLQVNLININHEIEGLVSEATKGNLSASADYTKYHGSWGSVVEGLNQLLKIISEPIEEATNVLEEVSRGNLNVSIEGDYKGDFKKIKDSVNSAVSSFSSYIEEISSLLEEMDKKNLDIGINREYLGDFNKIKVSINNIVETFNLVLSEINASSLQIASGSSQISESSMELAHGSTKQSNAVEELNVNVNNILEEIKVNTKNAEETRKLALDAKESADRGNSDMKEMLVSMEEINQASESISKIIKVIDDIAFQTNLLALNAAVEAARAGEHGKGFAVVAEEVRALAQRSKNAAAETNLLIETSIGKTSTGSIIANKTAETLGDIVEQVATMSELINSVANASKNQLNSIENINLGIKEVSQVTNITTATSEEAASAAEELSSQSEAFKSLVGEFSLKK